jgi:hypothetical protein
VANADAVTPLSDDQCAAANAARRYRRRRGAGTGQRIGALYGLYSTITNLINQAKALDDGTLALVDESTNSLLENLLLTESTTAVVDASQLPFTEGEAVAPAEAEGEDETESEILIQTSAFEELPKAVGHKVIITTTFGSKREGILKTAHNAGVTVYTNLRGSMADVNIPKADIAGAEVHWDTVKTQ